MDYREIVETEKWHLTNSRLSGLEIKVLFTMILSANYKTGLLMISQDDLSKTLKISRQSISRPIQKLIKIGAILQVTVGMGRAPSSFKIRTSEDMDLLCSQEVLNPAYEIWETERDSIFSGFLEDLWEIGTDCEKCKEGEMCREHAQDTKDFENRPRGKAYRLWLSDHPKPEYKVKKIILPCEDGKK